MCYKNKCAAAEAAKQHVGEWVVPIDGRHAQAVQYVMDEAAREGIELATPFEVMLFAVLTVERMMAARASFDVPPPTGRGAGS